MTKRFSADQALHATGQRGPEVVLATDYDLLLDLLREALNPHYHSLDEDYDDTKGRLRTRIEAVLSGGAVEPRPQHLPSESAMQIISAVCHAVSGTCVHVLKDNPDACTIENCGAVRAYLGAPETSFTLRAEPKPPHVHSDACWEPNSGCDIGRNEAFAETVNPHPGGFEV